MIVLLTGGSGCGKSTYAEKLTARLSPDKKVYIATMQVYDEESVRRVERHRKQRAGQNFITIECEKDVGSVRLEEGSTVLLEDLVNLTANEMFDGGDAARIVPDLTELAAKCRHLIMVTNDVFSEGKCYEASTQEYVRMLAQVNRRAAQMADCVIEMVYSIPIVWKGEMPCV